MVVLGRLTEPYGIRGWLHLHPFGDDPAAWAKMPMWWLRDEKKQGDWQAFPLSAMRQHGDGLVVCFEGVQDRTAAESMQGWLVGALRTELPETAQDEFYWADLIGLQVVNLAGESLGTVVGLLETGANDVLRVADATGSERLLPFVGSVVREVDVRAACIHVDWGLDW